LKPVEEYVLERIELRANELLTNGGRESLREAIAEELRSGRVDPKREMKEVRVRLKNINEDINRLLDSLSPINREFVDGKLLILGREKKMLEEKLRQLEVKPDEQISPDELTEQIVQGLVGFRQLFEQGTMEKLVVDPDACRGTLYLREFPLPAPGVMRRSSYVYNTGARY